MQKKALAQRLASASILLVVVLGLVGLDYAYPVAGVGGVWLLPLLLLFAIGTGWELGRLLSSGGTPLSGGWSAAIAAVVSVSAGIPLLWPLAGQVYPSDCPVGRLGWPLLAAVAVVSAVFVNEILRYGRRSHAVVSRIASTAFVATYVGLPLALLVAIRSLGEVRWGLIALVSMIAVTKFCDAGAYFCGSLVGRRKMIPRVSPGKTWEGTAGGVALGVLVAYGCAYWLFPLASESGSSSRVPLWGPAVFGLACSIGGVLGDLAESMMKRELGKKDSGSIFPGLGGIWDVSDSLIGAAGPAYLCLAAGLMG